MELWIRSQDKKRLYKVNELFVERDIYKDWCIETPIGNDYIVKTGYYVCCNVARFGRYETEERALEVLDEIQKIIGWLQNDMKDVTIGDFEKLIGSFDNYVYEMPQE